MGRTLQLVPRSQGSAAAARPPVDLHALCAHALELHQRGQLADAERVYRQVLDLDPRHADSLHLLGVLAHQVGRHDVAVELIRAAISADRRPAAYYSNLGTALQALGKLDEAAATYQRALDLKPDLAEALINLGAVLQAQGRLNEAENALRRAVALRPDLPEVHINLGNIQQARGHLHPALASHQHAVHLRPQFAEAWFNLANTLQAMGRLDEAVQGYLRCLRLKPNLPEAHGNLGNTLQSLQRLDEAVGCYQQALALRPDYAEALYNLGNARKARQNLDEAAACYLQALALQPALVQARYNLGITRHAQERLSEAETCFEEALRLNPEFAEARYNLGCVCKDQGRLLEAIQQMEQALQLQPDYPQAQFGLALAQIQFGLFAQGWRNYESRWQSIDHETPQRNYPQPMWAGEQLASGKVLLWAEQGIGDEILFAGLIPDALRSGNQFVLECDPRLAPLYARSFPEIEIVGTQDNVGQLAGSGEIAAQLPIGSLPGLFRASEQAFAAGRSPYLKADPLQTELLRARYSDGRRLVGIAWHTNNRKSGHKRSISLDLFAPLLQRSDLRFVSLQYGETAHLQQQADAASAPLVIDPAVNQLVDMDSFAAQIAAMDLVITIDNSTAHLAGALGKPVLLLLPFAADWRWLHARSTSPWYPSMRLFRQTQPGNWTEVIESVLGAL